VRPKLAPVTVRSCHLVLVTCVARELADLEQVRAKRIDLQLRRHQARALSIALALSSLWRITGFW